MYGEKLIFKGFNQLKKLGMGRYWKCLKWKILNLHVLRVSQSKND